MYLTAPHVAFGHVAAILPDKTANALQRNCCAALAAQMIDRPIAGDAEDPCLQASGGVVAIVVPPDLVEDLLQDVFGVVVANEPLQVPEHR